MIAGLDREQINAFVFWLIALEGIINFLFFRIFILSLLPNVLWKMITSEYRNDASPTEMIANSFIKADWKVRKNKKKKFAIS